MEQKLAQLQTALTDLRIEVKQLKAEVTKVKQEATTKPTAPNPVGTVVRAGPVQVVLRSSCVPMFGGNEDELTGGECISLVDSEMERSALTSDAERVNFAISSPRKGKR